MNRKVSLGVTVALILLAVAVTISATVMLSMRYFSGIVNGVAEREVMYDFIADVDKAIRGNYAGTIDEEALRQALAEGYAKGCGDPYAAYFTAEEYAEISREREGSYSGFGLETAVRDGKVVISAVYVDSAADTAGVHKEDVITALDEDTVTGADSAAVERRLRNPAKLLLSVKRGEESLSFTLSPTTIRVDSVESRLLTDGLTGYLRLRRLSDNTPEQFREALGALSEAGAIQYVLDLRDNAGGSLEAALNMLDYLLPRGAYARLVSGNSKQEPTVYTSSSVSQMSDKMVVLVNGATEGEAELMAGALQECAGALLVGDQTKGHALLQKYFTLESSSAAVRVSVGTLELIQGGSWEGVGLTPDRAVSLTGETASQLLDEKEDEQLQAALLLFNSAPDTSVTGTTAADSGTTGTGASGTGTGGTSAATASTSSAAATGKAADNQ